MTTLTTDSHALTNQLLINELDLWELFDSKSMEDNHAKQFYQMISDLIDTDLGASIDWLDSEEAHQLFLKDADIEKEIFDALEDAWDTIFDNHYEKVDDLLDAIYDAGKKRGYNNIRETIRYTDADIQAIRLAKDYNFDLIKNLTNDLHSTVKYKILQGIITGENPYNLSRTLTKAGVTRLDGSPFSARQRATMIAKTETSRMQNTGMLQSYVNEGYTQVKLLTAEDDDVCTTCLEYAYKFNNDEPRVFSPGLLKREKVHDIVKLIKGGHFPPFHPFCRCTYLTVWETKQDAPDNPPIINLTPTSAEIRFAEDGLPEPTREQLMKNLRPGEREKYENYKRNIPKQEEWLKNNPNAPAEEIAKHQKRLAFLKKKFNELKKKALGNDAHPKPKPAPKPKKEKPIGKHKPDEPKPEPEPLPEVKYDEKVSDLKKDLPLTDEALDEVLKWSSKKVKNKNRYGYEFNPETGELIGKEIRGKQGVIQFRDYYVDKPFNSIRTISNSEGQTFPSETDIKYSRALSGGDHIIVSDKELWYIRTPEKLDLHTVNHGQYEVDVVFKKAELAATKKVIEAKSQNKLDDKQLKELYDKTYGDTLLKEFNTREWVDRGFSIRRGYREDYKEPRKRKTNSQPKTKQSKPTSELNYDNLKTPEDVAAYYGLDYERGVDGKGRPTQKFTDHLTYTDTKTGKTINHDVEITFDVYFTKNTGAKKYIDNTNSGKCTYDLKEIIKMYKEAPEIFKFATRGIDFVNENKRRTLGYTRYTDKRVRILPNSFNRIQTERGNVRQTMYHEMSHCLDFSLIKKELIDAVKNPQKYSSAEVWDARERLNRREYGICSTKEWKEIVKKEEKWLRDNGYPVEHCSWYGDGWRNIDISENWAETGSMAAMDDLSDKSQATMQRKVNPYGYDMVYWDEWIKLHWITYNWAVEKWRSLKPTDFTYI
ncbi:phage minor head protein [Methanobrevibacter sp.]|uniref:phage minor head protein n=1 Tax=Methanobrevibacter sp. TaxID=66852 RepID=UPI0025FAEEAB|nr:phage minor head protein [Methanobrevibacter sp.]MBQ2832333.1 hypothetical protein [Methanobrevibacter sp.]